MKKYFTIKKTGSVIEFTITGEMGDTAISEQTAGDSVKEIKATIDGFTDVSEVLVFINSRGGSFYDALEIYGFLKDHPAKILVFIRGHCLSGASLVAMAGDHVSMTANSYFFMHECELVVRGGPETLRRVANTLDKLEEENRHIYSQKTGRSSEDLKKLAIEKTWFTAEDALREGFVDEVVPAVDFEDIKKVYLPTDMSDRKCIRCIEKIREEVRNEQVH